MDKALGSPEGNRKNLYIERKRELRTNSKRSSEGNLGRERNGNSETGLSSLYIGERGAGNSRE